MANVLLNTARHSQYRKFLSAIFISSIGNGIHFVAIPWLLIKQTGSASSMGWLLAIASLPGILFAPWIGVMVDRWSRRLICVYSDLIRGLILLVIPIVTFYGDFEVGYLYIIMFAVSIFDQFHGPASTGLMREMLSDDQLLSGNSLFSTADQIGLLIGTGIGGILISIYDPYVAIYINIISFLISGILTMIVKSKSTRSQISNSKDPKSGLYNEFLNGFRYLISRPQIIVLAILQLFVFLTLYVCNTLLPIFVDSVLNMGSRGYGFIEAAWAVGSVSGGLILTGILKRGKNGKFSILCLILMSLSLIFFLSSETLLQAMLGYFFIGLLATSTRISNDTMIQSAVEPNYLGRVNSTIMMFISYLSLGIYLAVGYLADLISIKIIYAFLSGIIGVGTFFIFMIKNRISQKIRLTSNMDL